MSALKILLGQPLQKQTRIQPVQIAFMRQNNFLRAKYPCHTLYWRGETGQKKSVSCQSPCEDFRISQRRNATTAQIASTTPNGHAPCKNP